MPLPPTLEWLLASANLYSGGPVRDLHPVPYSPFNRAPKKKIINMVKIISKKWIVSRDFLCHLVLCYYNTNSQTGKNDRLLNKGL